MTALVREQLQELMSRDLESRLVVTPLLDAAQIGPSSIDLRLGTQFLQTRRHFERTIDPFDTTSMNVDDEVINVGFGAPFVLHPGHFVLGSTLEFVRIPNDVSGQVLGRSSWGRLGLIVATAVVVQAGFAGCLTLELANEGSVPLMLRPGLRVAQLCLWQSAVSTDSGYTAEEGKYIAPLGPQSSRLGVETDELSRLTRMGALLAGGGTDRG